MVDVERSTGDRHHDVAGAHANGVAAIGVEWGYGSRAELEDAGADWICEHPDDVTLTGETNGGLIQFEGSDSVRTDLCGATDCHP